jgi:hypothetical protein
MAETYPRFAIPGLAMRHGAMNAGCTKVFRLCPGLGRTRSIRGQAVPPTLS